MVTRFSLPPRIISWVSLDAAVFNKNQHHAFLDIQAASSSNLLA
jgi:hypothetical protein